MKVVPYKAEHLITMTCQKAQFEMDALRTPKVARDLESTMAFSGIGDDGYVYACGGILQPVMHRGTCWFVFDEMVGPAQFMRLHRHACWFLEGCFIQRLEAFVDWDFKEGRRWVELLGFELECEKPIRAYMPDGRAAAQYARVLE